MGRVRCPDVVDKELFKMAPALDTRVLVSHVTVSTKARIWVVFITVIEE
jgi:hypothetical protein